MVYDKDPRCAQAKLYVIQQTNNEKKENQSVNNSGDEDTDTDSDSVAKYISTSETALMEAPSFSVSALTWHLADRFTSRSPEILSPPPRAIVLS
jgi:hypothetical protein